jgi:hypothetical protein
MEVTTSTPATTARPGGARGYHPTKLPSTIYAVGMVAVYVGERLLEVGKPSVITTLAGLLLTLVAIGLRARRLVTLPREHRAPDRWLLALYVVGLLSLLCYFVTSNVVWHLTGKTFAQHMPRVATVFSALWPALWLCAALPILFVELSLQTVARAPLLDTARVGAALRAALGISLALVFVFSANYVASERNVKKDFSYFRMARADEATKKIVEALDAPVQVYLFFPPANEVKEEVESYFSDLTRLSKHLQVVNYDHALHPAKARELNVSGNGVIVLARDTLKDQIGLPLELERARSQLRVLDQEVNKRLLSVTRKPRVAYFTQGHEERGFDPSGDTDRRGTIKNLKAIVTDQGFEPRELGLAQGLGTDVPQDATVVLIIGPRKPFSSEEIGALTRYLDRHGRLFIALDPDADVTLAELLGPLGLKFTPVTLAHDTLYARSGYNDADRINLVSASFSSHVSVSTIGRLRGRAPVVMPGAGYLDKDDKDAIGIVNVDFTVHADHGTFADKNRDFQNQPDDEPRKAYELAAAVNRRNASALLPEEEARAVVVADSDAFTDGLVSMFPGNAYLFLDALRWLGGEERFTGTISSEEDIPISHTRKQDIVWFYSTIFAAPALVLGLGFVMTRRGRRGRPARKGGPPAAPPAAGPTGASTTEAQS